MEGKKEAGLSVPDYIKQILKEYFENKDQEDSRNEWLEQFGREITGIVERVVRNCISGGNVNAMGTAYQKPHLSAVRKNSSPPPHRRRHK